MPKHSAKKSRRRTRARLIAALTTVGVSLVGYVTLGDKGLTSADAAGRLLMVSQHPDRSDASEMAYSTVSGKVYVFVKAVPHTSRIVFYVDSSKTPVSTESFAPFDLGTTAPDGSARPWDVSSLAPGQHAIHYTMTFGDRTVTNNATFTVAGGAPAAPRPPSPTAAATKAPAPSAAPSSAPPAATTPADPAPAPAAPGGITTPTNLDRAGRTVPDSAYPVPDGAVFMATNGSDDSPGTKAAPVYSLTRALSLVQPGGTVVVRGGTYRDAYTRGGNPAVVTKPFTLQAFPHEQVWFDGTDVIDGSRFTRDGSGRWSTSWSTPSFCMGSYYARPLTSPSRSPHNDQCAYADSALDPADPMANDPQMVFADGAPLHEVAGVDQVGPGTFYYAQDLGARSGRLYLGFDPAGRYVEATARPSALAVQGAGTRILGIGFRRYASNIIGQQTTGAVYSAQAPGLVLENDAFVRNAGPAFSGSLQRGVVRHSLFVGNGANGITSNGHYRGGGADDTVIETSLFSDNNAEHFDVGCSASCTVGNIKLNHMVGFTVRDNIVRGTSGHAAGIWCDLACTHGVIVRNAVTGNGGDGIVYEVSDSGIIASNLVADNGARGMTIASANTKIYNNTLSGQLIPFRIYDDSRSYGVDSWTDVGPDTRGLQVANNVVQGTGNMINCGPPMRAGKNQAPNTGCRDFFALLDFNTYAPANGVVSFQFADLGDSSTTTYKSLDAFRAAYRLDGHSDASGAAPSLAGVARAALAAPVTALPADVASAVGVAPTGLPRGAVAYPGR